MSHAPGFSGSIPPKAFDPASGSNSNAVNEGDAAVAAVARRTLAEAPEEQPAGGAGRAPVNRELAKALLEAASQGDAEATRALLGEGADPNAVEEEDGSTALMWAARVGNAKAIRVLLEGGADPDIVAEDGSTALMWAAHVEGEGVEALLEGGADPHIVAEDGSTALIWAALEGHAAFVRALLEKGADPNVVQRDGVTAILLAASGGHDVVVEALLEGGANPNAVEEEEGSTSLMWAADAGHATVVEVLLKWGADPHAANRAGSTAIQMVEGATSETGHQIHGLLLRAEELFAAEQRERERNVTELYATLVPGTGESMLH